MRKRVFRGAFWSPGADAQTHVLGCILESRGGCANACFGVHFGVQGRMRKRMFWSRGRMRKRMFCRVILESRGGCANACFAVYFGAQRRMRKRMFWSPGADAQTHVLLYILESRGGCANPRLARRRQSRAPSSSVEHIKLTWIKVLSTDPSPERRNQRMRNPEIKVLKY